MEREKLKSRLGFILLSAGCAIGIGNVWKFPYIAGQGGGGAFVLFYLIFLIILGLQSLSALLTIDPRLEQQFYVLKDIAVVTNLVPYLLVFAAVNVILHREPVDSDTVRRTTLLAGFSSLYSLYAPYACGPDAMMWGALATFGAIWLYG